MIKEKNYRLIKAIKESCKCNKEDAGGGGLTGNVLDDLVNAVTQGEYTKYDDVPTAIVGENPGWTANRNITLTAIGAPSLATAVIMPNTPPIMLAKDQTYSKGNGGMS